MVMHAFKYLLCVPTMQALIFPTLRASCLCSGWCASLRSVCPGGSSMP